jgi:hypothetical protein
MRCDLGSPGGLVNDVGYGGLNAGWVARSGVCSKRQVYGIHHHISVRHLGAYLGEMCYRYSRRDMKEGERVNDLLGRDEGRLTYKALTHAETEVPEAAGD